MLELSARYNGGVQFVVNARGHEVLCDQPLDNGGADGGITPPEFLMASLATCAGYYAAQYMKARKLNTEGLSVKVTAEKALKPARLSEFHVAVDAPGVTEEAHREGVLRAVHACLIHNTLLNPPAIHVEVIASHELLSTLART